jgi:hypothetical protein
MGVRSKRPATLHEWTSQLTSNVFVTDDTMKDQGKYIVFLPKKYETAKINTNTLRLTKLVRIINR